MGENRDKPFNFDTCKLCPYRTKSQFVMCKHIQLHRTKSKTDKFTCDSNTPELVECEICATHFDLKVDLTEHFRIFHEYKEVNEEVENILQCHGCEHCDFSTYSMLVLTKHLVSCNSMFRKNSSEARGSTQKENKDFSAENWFECSEFLEATRKQYEWFQCLQCDFKNKRRDHLQRHIIARHANPEDINWIRCDQCEFKTKQKAHLKLHVIAKHTNPQDIKWFRCVHCQFKAKRKCNLYQHITAKHSSDTAAQDKNWFICQQCDYKTRRGADLKRHTGVKHASPDEISWFQCEQCQFKTKQKCNLKVHTVKKHTNPKPYVNS